jgi:hypothetical protein
MVHQGLFSKIFDHEIRKWAQNEALTNNTEEIRQKKVRAFEEAKKLMAGVVFNRHGWHLDGTVFKKI